MSTRTLAAAARPSNVIPFPYHRARRAVPAPAALDPLDHGLALAERDCRAALLRDGLAVSEADALIADLLAHCAQAAAELSGGSL